MTDNPKILLSVIVPVFNEEQNIRLLCDAVAKVMEPLSPNYDYELLFTDNHSTDASFDILSSLATQNKRIRAIRFSRNFGYQRSILAGYLSAKGDIAVQLDCDLQDPPELIPQFIRKWEEGYKVVYGVRQARKESWQINLARKMFYRLINALSEDKLPLDAGDFRLVDRCILDEMRKISYSRPYLRGSIAAMGFKQYGLPYHRAARERGKSKFPLRSLIVIAIDGILNHSIIPLRIATFVSLAVSFLTMLAIIGYIMAKFFLGKNWPAGFATTTLLILFAIILNAFFLGIIGEYIGRIYQHIKQHSLVIIEKTINCEQPFPDRDGIRENK
jgi:glycosyltransferase involved in cell wall biosynthesis